LTGFDVTLPKQRCAGAVDFLLGIPPSAYWNFTTFKRIWKL